MHKKDIKKIKMVQHRMLVLAGVGVMAAALSILLDLAKSLNIYKNSLADLASRFMQGDICNADKILQYGLGRRQGAADCNRVRESRRPLELRMEKGQI